ncbi:MAG: C25 family cysteine peptidase [Candidatus Eisenbacteria bacterium]
MKRLVLLVGGLLLAVTPCFAEWVAVGEGAEELAVRVLESNDERVVLEYLVGGFERTPLDIEGAAYSAIFLGEESSILETGYPELPHVCRSVVIPDQGRMEVTVVSAEFEEIAGMDVAPSKGVLDRTVDPASVPHEFGDVYGRDEWYPQDVAWGREPYILRDFRGLCVVVQPFQYNAVSRVLRVFTRVVVEVRVAGPDGINELVLHHRDHMNDEFYQIYDRHFLNFEPTRYVPVGEIGEMLIITYDSFNSDVLPLVAWKNQMGVKTTLVNVSTIGNNSTSIKNYIQNMYNTTNLAFVLLVGDAAQIAYPSASGGASDPSYSLLAGGDNYPDIFVGRFSATSSDHVQTQVQRTIAYERDPMEGADWYHKGTGVASNQGPGDDGEYDNQHMDNIRTDLLNFTYTEVDRIYDPSANAAMVTAALNNGRSIVNYCGHGSTTAWGTTGFSVSHVNALVNDNMLPFIFDVACVNGNFTYSVCFAEAWMRATHNGVPTGAIGIYASSINQSWNSPMCGQDEMVDLLVTEQKRTFGGLAFNGSCRMMDEYGADGVNMFKTWHVFGDPSVRVRTDTPASLTVTHEATVDAGATTFAVSAPGAYRALCALSYNGAYLGSALTNAAGDATIMIEGSLPEGQDITLTVTFFNRTPYIAAVHVGPGIDPALSTIAVNDNLMLRPDGNGDSTMTIVVTVLDGDGDPVAGIPAGEIVVTVSGVSSLGKDVVFCATRTEVAEFVSTDATNASGEAVFEIEEVGGCGDVTATAEVQGTPLANGDVATVRSPDLNGDGRTNFQDTIMYAVMLNAGTGYCGNLNGSPDGMVNFQDTVKYVQALVAAAACP